MSRREHKILMQRKRNLARRLERRGWCEQPQPMFGPDDIGYEVSGRAKGIGCGGVGAMRLLVERLGLAEALNERVTVLKRHLPYWESDHILNLVYNILSDGRCLEDIELRRNNETYMDALSAERIPDPTTAGDFLRRFGEGDLLELMDAINEVRRKVWRKQPAAFRREAVIDVDGTIAPTRGKCKEGMDLSYKGIWGYAPLIVSLAQTREALFLVNRPGNAVSHAGAVAWIDRAIALTKDIFGTVWIRGDSDFSLTADFDRWDGAGVRFVFGMDAMANVVEKVESLSQRTWKRLRRKVKYTVATQPRHRPENVKARIVKERGYKNKRLVCEHVAQFDYRPTKCRKTYRVVVLRKNLSIERGENVLFPEIVYFFYITNDWRMTPAEVVRFANGRCDQENGIEQLKNGVRALRMPTSDLHSNWAYMIIATLAWNLKCWYGLLTADKRAGRQVVRMEFRRFLDTYIQIPCQIVRTGRRLIYRLLGYTKQLGIFLRTFDRLQKLTFP